MPNYQPIPEDQLSPSVLKALDKRPLEFPPENDFYFFIDNYQSSYSYIPSLDAANTTDYGFTVTIDQLAESLEDEASNQWDVTPKRVGTFLAEAPLGFALTHKLLQDIEVGYTAPEWDALGPDAPFVIISGRHRLVGILTAYNMTSISREVWGKLLVRVVAKVFATDADRSAAVFAANGSRSMTSGEKASVIAQSKNVSPDSIVSIAEGVEQRTIKPSVALGLALVTFEDDTSLTRQTLNLIGSSCGSQLAKVGAFKVHSFTDIVDTAKAQLSLVLESYDGVSNVARAARNIGADLAHYVLKAMSERTSPALSESFKPCPVVDTDLEFVPEPKAPPTNEPAPVTKRRGRPPAKKM